MDQRGSGMKAVVDTNVVAYFLLGTPKFVDEARSFWNRIDDLIAPSVWEAELANVVWMAVRAGVLPTNEGAARLSLAGRLGIHSVPSRTLWHGALARAIDSGVAVYDTLFIELADRERLPLATFDEKVLTTFPAIAARPQKVSRP